MVKNNTNEREVMRDLNRREKIEEFANNISVTWASICATRIMNGLLEQAGYIRQSPNPDIFKENKNE